MIAGEILRQTGELGRRAGATSGCRGLTVARCLWVEAFEIAMTGVGVDDGIHLVGPWQR